MSNADKAAEYYVDVPGFSLDWGSDDGGSGGISRGDCRMFLTNAPLRDVHGPKSPVIVWLNLDSRQEVRRAKFYRLTAKGRKQLEVETTKWDTLAAAVGRILRQPAQEK